MLLLFVTFGLILNTCTPYNPALYPSYDVLNPGPEVRKNPVAWVYWSEEQQAFIVDFEDGFIPDKSKNYPVIDQFMSLWIDELTEEIKRLRR